jgi:hypothetical protein
MSAERTSSKRTGPVALVLSTGTARLTPANPQVSVPRNDGSDQRT